MKLEFKAYKCIFPNFFLDFYDENKWWDEKQYEIIWGKNQKDAVNDRCKNDESYSFWELKEHIRTMRFPEKDFYSQEKSELLNDLTDKQIGHLLHSLGVQLGGFCPNEFYRNYSSYSAKHKDCDFLVSIGLMENWQRSNNEIYSVTEKGIEAIKTVLLVNTTS
jgi:hypothetical protein